MSTFKADDAINRSVSNIINYSTETGLKNPVELSTRKRLDMRRIGQKERLVEKITSKKTQ